MPQFSGGTEQPGKPPKSEEWALVSRKALSRTARPWGSLCRTLRRIGGPDCVLIGKNVLSDSAHVI